VSIDCAGDLGPVAGEQDVFVPAVFAHESLEVPDPGGVLDQGQGHRLGALPLDVAAQAGQIGLTQTAQANVSQDVPVPVVKADQRLDQRLDVFGGPIRRGLIGKGGWRRRPLVEVHHDLRLVRFSPHEAHVGAEA
jgi:hypothetical protein